MTKKEFIKRMNKIKNKNLSKDLEYTCSYIYNDLGICAKLKYDKIIKPYLDLPRAFIRREFLDCNNSMKTVRILALTTFEIECLESGIYKEF